MTNERAIPEGYMTVGEVAKKMGVTVRTLQYYDKEGLFSPSGKSEGGRRLYTDKDLVRLHQILSLKSLGFSLEDIRKRLISLDTPEAVAKVLEEQAEDIRHQIEKLSESLGEIEKLREEVLKMHTVNFRKYADIIVNLQMKNEFYYLIKRFDDDMLDHIRQKFDRQSGLDFLEKFNGICDEIYLLAEAKVPQDSEQCQKLTADYWNLIMEFTGGDMSMLPKLMEMGDQKNVENERDKKQQVVNEYMEPALGIYFSRLGQNPFGEIERGKACDSPESGEVES